MHDYSLPTADRLDAEPADLPAQLDRRQAAVIVLPNGTYFRAWSTRGIFSVRILKEAKLFFPADGDALKKTLAKLYRRGLVPKIAAVALTVAGGSA